MRTEKAVAHEMDTYIGGNASSSGSGAAAAGDTNYDVPAGATDIQRFTDVRLRSGVGPVAVEETRFRLSAPDRARAEAVSRMPQAPARAPLTLEPSTASIPFSTTAEFDAAVRARSPYLIRASRLRSISATGELIFATEPAPVATAQSFFIPPGTRVAPLYHRSLVGKMRLMYQFARGLADLHASGYLHLNVTHNALTLTTCGTSNAGRVRGVVSDFSSASGTGITTDVSGRRMPMPLYTRAARSDPRYRAPECFYIKRGSEVFPHVSGLADANFFECTDKSDVFSLGLCFCVIIGGAHPFVFTNADRPFVSARGRERLLTLTRKTSNNNPSLILRAMWAECAKWQTFKMLGTTEPNDLAGDRARWFTTSVVVGRASEKGLLPGISRSAAILLMDLLWGMLVPNVTNRISMRDVVAHPIFAQFVSEEEARPIRQPPVPQYIQFAPRSGWSKDKDAAVVRAVGPLFSSVSVAHLPFEVIYIAYDLAARVAGTFESPANAVLLQAATAAAVRAAILLFDLAQSVGDDLPSESTISWQLLPIVVDFFGGLLRRREYLYTQLGSERTVRAVANLFVSDDGAPFRAAYLELNVPAAAKILTRGVETASRKSGRDFDLDAAAGGPVTSADACFANTGRTAIPDGPVPTLSELFSSGPSGM